MPPGRKKTGIIRPCEACGKDHYVKQWQLRQGHGRFCSNRCQAVWQARDSKLVVCEQCGAERRFSPFQAAKRRYCSRECLVAARITTGIGRDHNGKPAIRDNHGYVRVWQPDHSMAGPYGGWVLEHRLIVETDIGRALSVDETVHHANGVRDDNRIENLVMLSRSEHTRVTSANTTAKRRRERAELAEYRRRFGSLTNRED